MTAVLFCVVLCSFVHYALLSFILLLFILLYTYYCKYVIVLNKKEEKGLSIKKQKAILETQQ